MDYARYTVHAGDTIYKIAKAYNVEPFPRPDPIFLGKLSPSSPS